ncbi:ATP-dependent DNA helicase PIF1-like protein, partial [Tanacetum coccineum]
MLLNKVKGATGWESFKEYDNVVYNTYKEACFARGLLDGDKEYIDGIIKASEWGMGEYLQKHFVMLIMSESMSIPEVVWEKTWRLLAEDVLEIERQKRNNTELELSDTQREKNLYKMLIVALRSKGEIVLNVASSEIAALLLDGGRTTHSWFAIPININEDSLCTITTDSDLADLIHETKLIIWDEAPMV